MPQINSEYFGRVLRDAFRLNNQPEGLVTDNYVLPVFDLSPPSLTAYRNAITTTDNAAVAVGSVSVPTIFGCRMRVTGPAAGVQIDLFTGIPAGAPFKLNLVIGGDGGAAGINEFSIEARWGAAFGSKHMFYERYNVGTLVTRWFEPHIFETPFVKLEAGGKVIFYANNIIAGFDVMCIAQLTLLPS